METKRCPKCRKLMVLVFNETDDGAVAGNPLTFWRCGCGHREYGGYQKRDGEPEWVARWRATNRL